MDNKKVLSEKTVGLKPSGIRKFFDIVSAAVITDAFYSLNVFGVGPRYYRAIMYILITSGVMLLIGCLLSRRTSYKSL